MALVLT
jgi:hypothetical protein